MNNIVITEKGVIYNERLFRYSEYKELLKIIPKKINIIIADEDILIKVYKNKENIKNLIDDDFFSGNGLLIDNYYDKKDKSLILYGIRSNNIDIFYNNNIKSIMPIQKLVANYLVDSKKIRNLKFSFKFNNKTYLGIIKKGNLIEGRILRIEEENYKDDIREVFLEIRNRKVIIS